MRSRPRGRDTNNGRGEVLPGRPSGRHGRLPSRLQQGGGGRSQVILDFSSAGDPSPALLLGRPPGDYRQAAGGGSSFRPETLGGRMCLSPRQNAETRRQQGTPLIVPPRVASVAQKEAKRAVFKLENSSFI